MEGVDFEALGEKFSEILSILEDTKLSEDLSELEETLNYRFVRKQLLEEALTHSSVIPKCNALLENLGIPGSDHKSIRSYERLEFVGDAVLGQVITSYLYSTYPDLDPGILTRLRSENVRNENLARIAVRHGFHNYLRLDCKYLQEMINKFVEDVEKKPNSFLENSRVPKILADVVESIVGAVFVDSGHSTDKVWEVFGSLLQPLVNPVTLEVDPIVKLQELCQKKGKIVDYRKSKSENMVMMEVYIDGQRAGSAENKQKKMAKRAAARNAYHNLFAS